MAESSIDVERVVREVMARLGPGLAEGARAGQSEAGRRAPRPTASSGGPRPSGPPSAKAAGGQLAVAGPVVTMAELSGRLDGVRRLVVRPQAVITPSVRDELNRRNVTLVRDAGAPAPSSDGCRVVMMVLGSRFDPRPLTRALENEGVRIETRPADCLVAATDQLAEEVAKPNTLGVVVSTYPAVALCLANRQRGVRAVLGIDAGGVAGDAASVGANVLVVDPKAAGLFPMRQMISRFSKEGPWECPEVLRERLG